MFEVYKKKCTFFIISFVDHILASSNTLSRGVQPTACWAHAAQNVMNAAQHKIINLLKT